ncbi:MAG: MBOAT family O-acyltransferase [bacterium]
MSDLLTYLASLFVYNDEHPLLFTQIHFWVFFLLVYVGFSLIVTKVKGRKVKKTTFRNAYLFSFSLIFYYKTSGLFVLLLVFSTLLGWILGIKMDNNPYPSQRKALCSIGIVLNLAMLCFFKYAYFFTDIFNATFNTEYSIAVKILLPVGISFFTFQNISYIVDVYKRKIAHVSNILDFGFYTAFFPQLVAGPILRADQFVPQLYKPFFLSRRQFGIAIFWICNGLIKKIVLSDYLAVNFADRVFANPLLYTPFENFSALMVYSLQVYADFSGYTDIAIGVAMMMGFYLPVNFNSPYKAQNPTDFWRRWHMSLSRWLRDYLYIPLGGNRTAGFTSYFILAAILAIAAFRLHNLWFSLVVVVVMLTILLLRFFCPSNRRTLGTNVNNMDTMLLGGLWHGASFNFITWGGLNGLGILVHKWWKDRSWRTRLSTLVTLTLTFTFLAFQFDIPLLNLLWYYALILLIGFTIVYMVSRSKKLSIVHSPLSTCWSVLITFIFISFTRLFFRSGSNLDPAEANEVAWNTASQMVHQIGSHWNLSQIPDILSHYSIVFLLFAFGMTVHWLPTRFKRRYRLWFASLPLWFIGICCVLLAVTLYQFVTADLQPFIYFQF